MSVSVKGDAVTWLGGEPALESDAPGLESHLYSTGRSSFIGRPQYYLRHSAVVRINEIEDVRNLEERLANSKQSINGKYYYLDAPISPWILGSWRTRHLRAVTTLLASTFPHPLSRSPGLGQLS